MSIPTVDRISALPNPFLCHILSFLPTKIAAATSILSKRWNPLWLSLLTLHFDDQNFTNFADFRHFVYSVMFSRKITQPILSCSLKCGNFPNCNKHDINRFIDAVVQRGIQNLNLAMSSLWFELPPCVFSCSNLTVLQLKMLKINYHFDINFPLLKTLYLDSIYFSQSHTDIFKTLLYGCPVLEDLQTNRLMLSPIKAKEFNGLLKLVKARISNSITWSIPFDWVRNAKFLYIKLKYPYDFQVPTFVNLTHLEIAFKLKNDLLGKWKWKWLTEVLQHFPKLQNLTIHQGSSYPLQIRDVGWIEPPIIPECLSFHLRTCSVRKYRGTEYELKFAKYIMQNSKVLKTMTIESSNSVDLNVKLQILTELCKCPRVSTTCKLLFDC